MNKDLREQVAEIITHWNYLKRTDLSCQKNSFNIADELITLISTDTLDEVMTEHSKKYMKGNRIIKDLQETIDNLRGAE